MTEWDSSRELRFLFRHSTLFSRFPWFEVFSNCGILYIDISSNFWAVPLSPTATLTPGLFKLLRLSGPLDPAKAYVKSGIRTQCVFQTANFFTRHRREEVKRIRYAHTYTTNSRSSLCIIKDFWSKNTAPFSSKSEICDVFSKSQEAIPSRVANSGTRWLSWRLSAGLYLGSRLIWSDRFLKT